MTPPKKNQPPTPKAVAIKGADNTLGEDGQSQPKIIAKGSGALAEKILDIAFAEGVKVRQDKDLTELLDAFDVESPIPLEALHAVSLILERVYAENNKMSDKTQKDAADNNWADADSSPSAPRPQTLDGQTGKPITGDDTGNNTGNNSDRAADMRGPA